MNNREVSIQTEDGFTVVATMFSTEKPPKAGVIINSATAVKQGYYSYFAEFLANKNYLVLTYDYRGIGKSSVANSRDKRLTMQSWGEYDFSAVIDWATTNYGEFKWHCVGHSVGGQIIGFAKNNTKLSSFYCVSSQSGYWGLWDFPHKLKMIMLWYILVPLCSTLLGHLPRFLLGGETLPAGIAQQWGYWGRHKDYIVDKSGIPIRQGFESIKCDMKFLQIDDDQAVAPPRAVSALKSFYKNANTNIQTIRAKDYSKNGIGHFGFFRKKHKSCLWLDVVNWLD